MKYNTTKYFYLKVDFVLIYYHFVFISIDKFILGVIRELEFASSK